MFVDFVAVLALPVRAPTKVVEVTDVRPARVVDVPPSEIAVEPIVTVPVAAAGAAQLGAAPVVAVRI